MLINGIDLSAYGVTLHNRVLTSNEVKTTCEWLEGDIQPTFVRQQDSFKSVQLEFLVAGENEETAFITMSKLTAALKKATVVFEDIPFAFDVTLSGETSQTRLKNGNFILSVNLDCGYAKGETEVYTTDSRATDYFRLTISYYQDGVYLLNTETKLIKASDFTGDGDTFESLGIDLNKYQPDYYNAGFASNFSGVELTYSNLYNLQYLIVNYSPTTFTKTLEYEKLTDGIYLPIASTVLTYTKKQVDSMSSIGQLIDLTYNKPEGYSARTSFDKVFSFENLLAFGETIHIYYDEIENERVKDIAVRYYTENNDGQYIFIQEQLVNIREGNVVDGLSLRNLINVNAFKPEKYYNDGYCVGHDMIESVSYDTLENVYEVRYDLTNNMIFVEYYLGTYPNWLRVTTTSYHVKYNTAFDTSADIIADIGIDLNKYKTEVYNDGIIYNGNSLTSFDNVLNAGVIQVYYEPKEYEITVRYFQDDVATGLLLGSETVTINDFMFMSNPTLSQVVELNKYKPEAYIFNQNLSYNGEVNLSALTAASPIQVVYTEIEEVKTKSIVVKYKKELSAAYSTINTSVVTISEDSVGGGITLAQLFDLNAYKPDYYENGIVDGYSSTLTYTFEDLQGTYDVLYTASYFTTQVRYYTDEIDNYNWIGSNSIQYRIIDFTTETTLTDLGLNINAFKPSYGGDGVVQYNGPVTFSALIALDAIDIVYPTVSEPGEDEYDFPHRVLFLQHNDMGAYESQFPNWTLNHAYINTGVTVDDMSKLSVICDTMRVFEDQPLQNVNVEDAYLFGSVTSMGSYYIKFVNNSTYKAESLLTGINTFNAMAGLGTPELVQEEAAAVGFSKNTGITSSTRDGYSYVTLTYSNLLQSNSAKMIVPLYLFACNYNGQYRGGIAGVGIKGCKIYYEDTLIRDFIPVAFYDKIGDLVAPSNCLYDKVTQTFFEDARELNSFNIMDDPDYTDTNPAHKIGCCYVNYYKDNQLFNTATIWFRGDEFEEEWDLEERFFVDYYQPQFYGTGVIENLVNITPTFDGLKNKVFNVHYTATGYGVTVNYWKDNKDDQANLLATETVELTEKMFYQVPTFGQLIDLFKYKPEGYKPTHSYTDSKVTLNRILQAAPIDIIYVEVENPQVYTTTVKYYRKVFGIDTLNPLNTYNFEGQTTVSIDETWFVDGKYPEDFMDFNLFHNQPLFYLPGEPWDWYTKDENLTDPSVLKDEYIIVYNPVSYFVDIDYYTDVVEEENLVASSTWEVKIDNWKDGEQFQLIDELPNNLIDKFKPVICGGGRLEDPTMWYTFETLVAGPINIIYDTLDEPHDPESTMWPSKVLYWYASLGEGADTWAYDVPDSQACWQTFLLSTYITPEFDVTEGDAIPGSKFIGPRIPYLDLGYTPKEIGRLRMETKAYCCNAGVRIDTNENSVSDDGYSYFLGYYGALDSTAILNAIGNGKAYTIARDESSDNSGFTETMYSNSSVNSRGWFAFGGHTVGGRSWSMNGKGPQALDGNPGWNNITQSYNYGHNEEKVRELVGGFRRGNYAIQGDDWEDIHLFGDYVASTYNKDARLSPNRYNKDFLQRKLSFAAGPVAEEALTPVPCVAFNPSTMIVDAYHDYYEIYDYTTSQKPFYVNEINRDNDMFLYREKPKGSITLFITTNPTTGKLNMMTQQHVQYPKILASAGIVGFPESTLIGFNPYSNSEASFTYTTQVITGTMDDGTPIYQNQQKKVSIAFATEQFDAFAVPSKSILWGVKIWDRDRLVRDLIPVAEGDKIYDYIAPANCLFDKVTEIFFTNQNFGGEYHQQVTNNFGKPITGTYTETVEASEVFPLRVSDDPTIYGNIVANYYDDEFNFLGNQYVEVPVHYTEDNISIEDLLHANDFKPSDYYHDGMIDVDLDFTNPNDETLHDIYQMGAVNIFYKLNTFTKTVVYYQGDTRIASKDFFYSTKDIENAETLADLGVDPDLYYDERFAHGRIVFNEAVIADTDIESFIDAPSPIIVYDKLTQEEAPNLLYLEYFREGAYNDTLIVPDPENENYFNCELEATILNPNGAIKYLDHYHSALYEDEKQDYFIAYQIKVNANYCPVHKGPARRYQTLATIVDNGIYTVVEEKRGWGRLKEYPKGWILLSYTEPITGPGQNPDYEVPGLADVTIPFAEKITVSKLTVDRLWAYSPEHASWLKTEEMSFDQTGRLYNAIKMEVLNLDDITNWSTATALEDLNIYPDAYQLKYHEPTDYVYTGEYTYDAFSALHDIEFVYPETIYPYVVLYYKDTILEANEVGRESFSCSISDWNPDWDTFIATSWLYDEDGNMINPTLYRDTDLTLNWDFFGVSKNAHKPTVGNYDDGVWLWNPRSWDNKDIYFTFEELVSTGSQTILYLPTLNNYKAVYNGAWTKLPWDLENYTAAPNTVGVGVYDVEFKYQKLGTGNEYQETHTSGGGMNPLWSYGRYQSALGQYSMFGTLPGYPNSLQKSLFNYQLGSNSISLQPTYEYYNSGAGNVAAATYYTIKIQPTYIYSDSDKFSYYNTVNFSNKRKQTVVMSWGHDETNFTSDNYIENVNQERIKVTRELNMKDEAYYRLSRMDDEVLNGYLFYGGTNTLTPDSVSTQTSDSNNHYTTLYNGIKNSEFIYIGATGAGQEESEKSYSFYPVVWYYVKTWENYYLTHYYVPLPKGTWLSDGRQVPYNTFYDVVTNTICESYADEGTFPTIFKLGDNVEKEPAVDYFEGWNYDYTECNYTVQTIATIKAYSQPDILSTEITSYPSGMVIPVSRYTADAANRVIGEWYYNGAYWFLTENTEIISNDVYNITELRKSVGIKGDTENTAVTYNAYLTPSADSGTSQLTFKSETATNVYFTTSDFYWNGFVWVPISYTSDNVEDKLRNGVVTVDYLNHYKYPIMNDTFKLGQYTLGDRVTIVKQLVKDNNWQLTDTGHWIYVYQTISDVVQ